MANKQFFKFEKGQIVAYNDFGQSLHEIGKKLNCHHLSSDVFYSKEKKRKLEIISKKKFVVAKKTKTKQNKKKTLHLKIQKFVRAVKQHYNNSKLKLINVFCQLFVLCPIL